MQDFELEYLDYSWGHYIPSTIITLKGKRYRFVKANLLRIYSKGIAVLINGSYHYITFSTSIKLVKGKVNQGYKVSTFKDEGNLLAGTGYDGNLVDMANMFNEQFTRGYYLHNSVIQSPDIYLVISNRDTIKAIGYRNSTTALNYECFATRWYRWGSDADSYVVEVRVAGEEDGYFITEIPELGSQYFMLKVPGYTKTMRESFILQFKGQIFRIGVPASLFRQAPNISKFITATSRPIISNY